MHRSGTSCLIGSLQHAGLCLGEHSTWHPFNRRGNRENPAIDKLHDDLLATAGGRWDDPPARVDWLPRHVDRAREIVSAYPAGQRWGFKDPKTLQALDGWQALLGELLFIGIYRHPVSVARSLMSRNGMPQDHALRLWLDYNGRLLDAHDRDPFPIVSFDWDEETFHGKLNTLLPRFGLRTLGDSEEDRFFTRELRHHEDPARESEVGPLPEEVDRLLAQLRERAV